MPFFPEAFTEGLSVPSSGHHRRSSSRHRTSKRRRSRSSSRDRDRGSGNFVSDFFGKDSSYNKHNASRGSFFGLPLGNTSRGSLFGPPPSLSLLSRPLPFPSSSNTDISPGNSRSSYYKRSPRKGFMQRSYKQLKRLIRDLLHWFKRHPWKVFFMVIMPLVTGGALTALLARFGLRMPPSLERALGMASRAASGDGFGFVSDAMRMAGGGPGAGAGAARGGFASASYDRYSRGGGGSFDAFEGFGRARSHGGGGDDWSSGLVNGVAKMFI
ncbi:hypothetical protein LEL_05057 [Akanthomyces lecanii RCEF 1005]|uniref:Uncharacterized protein n=1 Tax=Akanthomyces lecanii RCEF 1005 TaxID=1081108 RepID=A0A168HTH1_CORDF|nr:hypothetical protein LEL_05057 [Akanthomyces lecanii RCEF 1005]